MLELVEQVLRGVGDLAQLAVSPGLRGGADEAVVAHGLAVLRLLRLERADEANWDEASGVRRRLDEDEDVERVAVVRRGGRDGSEVEGKNGAGREDVRDRVAPRLPVELE